MPAQITALPTPPSTNDPANFNTRADAFLGQMPTFVTEANALATEVSTNAAQVAADRIQTNADRVAAVTSATSALSAPGTNGTSSTSLTVGTGAKTFTTQTGKAWVAGQGFFIASSTSPTNWMSGILTAYNSGTGAATVQVDTIGGSGTLTAWNCGLSAGRPMAVATQAQAEAGTDATTMMTPERTAQAALVHAFPVGGVMQAAAIPDTRWLPCKGLLYSIASYPRLASVLPVYLNPMTSRLNGEVGSRLAYGGGIFMSWLGYPAYVPATSPDGVVWTRRASPFGSSNLIPEQLVYSDGLFLVCQGAQAFSSADGITWTACAHPLGGANDGLYSLVKGGSLWMAVGKKDGSPYMATSPDGITWTQKPSPGGQLTYRLAYSPPLSRWLACTEGGSTWTSDNGGVSWQTQAAIGRSTYQLAWSGDRFMAIGYDFVAYSTNGASFSQPVTLSFPIYSLYGDGARFYIGGRNGELAVSSDGASWSQLASMGSLIAKIVKANSALTTPIVLLTSNGICSGLDVSTTQFQVPDVASAGVGLSPYIKAL